MKRKAFLASLLMLVGVCPMWGGNCGKNFLNGMAKVCFGYSTSGKETVVYSTPCIEKLKEFNPNELNRLYVTIQSLQLNYDLKNKKDTYGNSFADAGYTIDHQELNEAHFMAIYGPDYGVSGTLTLDKILAPFDRYHRENSSREPSVAVSYSGMCDKAVTVNYVAYGSEVLKTTGDYNWDGNKAYALASCAGSSVSFQPAPRFSSREVFQNGNLTVKTIKTQYNGLQLTWQTKIDQNDIANLTLVTRGEASPVVVPLSLDAVITSSVPKGGKYNKRLMELIISCIGIRYRPIPLYYTRGDNGSEFSLVENTLPEELAGKALRVVLSDEKVSAPQLQGPVYVGGKARTDISWDRPYISYVIEQ